MSNSTTRRLKLPRPLRAIHTRIRGENVWMEANSRLHAKRLAKSILDDMRLSVRLTAIVTAPSGHIGLGHAGYAAAVRGVVPRKRGRR